MLTPVPFVVSDHRAPLSTPRPLLHHAALHYNRTHIAQSTPSSFVQKLPKPSLLSASYTLDAPLSEEIERRRMGENGVISVTSSGHGLLGGEGEFSPLP